MYPSFTSTFYNYINNTNLSRTHQEDYCLPLSSSFQLPSPHYITLDDEIIFNELLQQEHLFSIDHGNHNANNISFHQQLTSPEIRASIQSTMGKETNNNGDVGFNKPKTRSKRRRALENDQKNKINTAQGPRDRRMRLSIEVSKKFFKLQDMLGFDKASETVEWLLMKSKSNIQELIPHGKSSFLCASTSESSTPKCELLSEYIDGDQNANTKSSSSSNRKGKKKTSKVRKSFYLYRPFAKETREMARKRARERTLEKRSKLDCVSGVDDQFPKFRPCLDLTMDQGVNSFGSWIINQPEQPLQNKGVSQPIGIGSWKPSFLFDHQQSGLHPQEMNEFSDFQILGNLWEVKN